MGHVEITTGKFLKIIVYKRNTRQTYMYTYVLCINPHLGIFAVVTNSRNLCTLLNNYYSLVTSGVMYSVTNRLAFASGPTPIQEHFPPQGWGHWKDHEWWVTFSCHSDASESSFQNWVNYLCYSDFDKDVVMFWSIIILLVGIFCVLCPSLFLYYELFGA